MARYYPIIFRSENLAVHDKISPIRFFPIFIHTHLNYSFFRKQYLCLKGDAYTDSDTALAADELRTTHLPMLCCVPLSNVVLPENG